jgi:hypothetical protein
MLHAAVLTGDLVASTAARPDDLDRAMQTLKAAAEAAALSHGLAQPRFTRFRGDGWQVMIAPPHHYLRVTAVLLAALHSSGLGLHTRIGIGIGTIDHPGGQDLSDAAGSAFIRSGRALDSLTGPDRLAIAGLPGDGPAGTAALWHAAALETLAHFSARWSREQAEALHLRLLAGTRPLHHIAAGLGISRQALSARLAIAGERPLLALLRAAEAGP